MSERVPPALEAAIKADFTPVSRLRPPLHRAVLLAPLVTLTLVLASRLFNLRVDAGTLGWTFSWGMSVAQAALALALITLALREAVPGRTVGAVPLTLAAFAALGFTIAVTLRTWSMSPTTIVGASVAWVNGVCFIGTAVTALPLLIAAAVLARRAFAVRPSATGGLFGLGAGLGADAGWRLFCHFSDPAHVFLTHTGAIVATALLGMVTLRATRAIER